MSVVGEPVFMLNAGEWVPANAGGCRNHESFPENPQFALSISHPTVALFTLTQHISPLLPIGFYVLNHDGETMGKGAFMHSAEVSPHRPLFLLLFFSSFL